MYQYGEEDSEQLEIGDDDGGGENPVNDYNFDMDDIEND